jgi:hypothetical protein
LAVGKAVAMRSEHAGLGKVAWRCFLLGILFAAALHGQTFYEAHQAFMKALASVKPPPLGQPPSERAGPVSFSRSSAQDWARLVDATWGAGPPTSEKLRVFDTVWNEVDRRFAAFVNLDADITAFRDRYRPEIARGVSRGRFAAILNQFALSLKEAHTLLMDQLVNWATDPRPGVPLFAVGAWLDDSRFGASLTPLPDGSLLVFRALPNHVLGLEPGDIVLGYDGVPWRALYRELLDAELPLHLTWVLASTDESMEHCMLMSVGLNWHLFDTMDVVKYRTGETQHLPTAPLAIQVGHIAGNEQLPVPGVPMPDLEKNIFVTWGIVEGRQVGYIYVASWSPDEQYAISDKFYEAVHTLLNHSQTKGLIIDFRLNVGGYMLVAHRGYSLLFGEDVAKVAYDVRDDPTDHMSLKPHPFFTADLFTIPGGPRSYGKPIAILTGPGAVSNGDWESLRLRFHPMARSFGKPSNGAFSSETNVSVGSDWYFSNTYGVGYLVEGHRYLVHSGAPVDEPVWLKPEDVARGRDTVVEAALSWIERSQPRLVRKRIDRQR